MTGKVILETTKVLKIKSLVFIGKGRARVCWRENHGDNHHVYWANEKFYSIKHHILAGERQDGGTQNVCHFVQF